MNGDNVRYTAPLPVPGIPSLVKVKPGCKGDARMNKAVDAKLKDPSLTLYDALLAGGFNYPRNVDAFTIDNDWVTLGQRKNQLNRRLRMARSKAKSIAKESSRSQDSGAKTSSVGSSAALKVAGSYVRQQERKRVTEARQPRGARENGRSKKQRANEPASQVKTQPLITGPVNGNSTRDDSCIGAPQLSSDKGFVTDLHASSSSDNTLTPDQSLSLASILMDVAFNGTPEEEFDEDDLSPRRCFSPGYHAHHNGEAYPMTKQVGQIHESKFHYPFETNACSFALPGVRDGLIGWGQQIANQKVMPTPQGNIMALQSGQPPLVDESSELRTRWCLPSAGEEADSMSIFEAQGLHQPNKGGNHMHNCVSAESSVCATTYNRSSSDFGAHNIHAICDQNNTLKQNVKFFDLSSASLFYPSTTGPYLQQQLLHMVPSNSELYQQNDMFSDLE